MLREVAPEWRRELAPLFGFHPPYLLAAIAAVLEGRAGRAWIAGGASAPTARLAIGCYDFFGGEPDPAAADDLCRGVGAPRELVYGNDPRWAGRLRAIFAEGLAERPMRSYDGAGLAREHLRKLAASLPPGASLRLLDASDTAAIDAELSPNALQVYETAADFAREGFGFGVFSEGRLACAATSYAVGGGAVEVAIATRPAFRARGFAAAASARFLLEAAARGLEPRWNASNPVSQRLAARLGLRPAGVCEVLYRA